MQGQKGEIGLKGDPGIPGKTFSQIEKLHSVVLYYNLQ